MRSFITIIQKILPRRKIDIFGEDSWMNSTLPYYILAIITSFGIILDNVNPYILVVVGYALFPILDQIYSLDERNPTKQERMQLQKRDLSFKISLYAAVLLDWILLVKYLKIISQLQVTFGNIPYVLGLIIIFISLQASQFAVAHQLMHKNGGFDKQIGTIHMIKSFEMHFTYHHLYKHHSQVATPSDPSSAPKGINVYNFVANCVIQSWIGVYQSEKKQGKSFVMNYAILSLISYFIFMVIIYSVFGWKAFLFHFSIAIGSIFYLEAINYIQHYGLRRKLLKDGTYQKVNILHSWNAPHRFTNYLFFKLQRHSDHHQNSSKPYQTLVSLDQSPFLPHGYTLMILMSFFPKIWFRIMDPLADAYSKLDYQNKEKIDANIKEIALKQTRKFLIEVAMSTIVLLILSILLLNIPQ